MGLFLFFLLLLQCTAHHYVEPLNKGQVRANTSLGGPIVKVFGARIPVPYLTSGVQYGYSDRLLVGGNLHLFPLAYKMAGADIGCHWFPIPAQGFRPIVGLGPRILLFSSLKSDVDSHFKIYPGFSMTAAWPFRNRSYFAGLDIFLTDSDYNDEHPSSILSPFVGMRWSIGRSLFLLTEIKWQGANIESDKLAITYLPIGSQGAIATLFSIEKGF